MSKVINIECNIIQQVQGAQQEEEGRPVEKLGGELQQHESQGLPGWCHLLL
jgi:hypothetical protein